MQFVDLQHLQIPLKSPVGARLAREGGLEAAKSFAGKPRSYGSKIIFRDKPRLHARFPAPVPATLRPARCPGATR
ncbi:hypothetical protein EB795_17675 [Pseudomonas mandelii]|nr:hypothetical protein [Pseudomonas mandelii]